MKMIYGTVLCAALCGAVRGAQPYDAALDYVETDGAQYFDTGLILSNDVAVTMELMLKAEKTPSKTQGCIFGARTGYNSQSVSIFLLSNHALYLDFNDGDYELTRLNCASSSFLTNRLRLVLSSAKREVYAKVNDRYWSRKNWNVGVNTNVFCTATTARIFDLAGGTLDWAGRASARLYALRIEKGAEVLRDYQPCVKDGCVGLYDRATKTFLAPAAGVCAAGPVVVTPARDLASPTAAPRFAVSDGPVAYLESDGTAYLDTGVTMTSDMSADLVYEIRGGTGAVGLFGARSSVESRNIALSYNSGNGGQLTADFNNGTYESYRLTLNGYSTNLTYRTHLGNDRCATVNLMSQRTVSSRQAWSETGTGDFTAPGSAYVFKTRGTTWGTAVARLYALAIYTNGTLLCDYEPYLKDGVACLHDRVADTFLFNANAAGGAFTAGPSATNVLFAATETNAVPRVTLADLGTGASAGEVWAVTTEQPVYDRAVAYVESDGSQSFDTGLPITGDMDVTITYAVMDYSNGPAGLFGARTDVNVRNAAVSYATTTQISCDFHDASAYDSYRAGVTSTVAGKIYTSRMNAQMRTVGGHTNSAAIPSTAWTTDTNAFIFATGGTNWKCAKARLYALRITRGGEVLRDYQPCVKDGLGGLFERVERRFLLPSGGVHAFGVGETVPTPETDYPDAPARLFARPRAVTNRVLAVSGSVTNRFPIGPLQPGTRYACTLVATNGLADGAATLSGVSLFPCRFETKDESLPAAESTWLGVAVSSRKGGSLAFRVTRTGTAATRLRLLHGATASGTETAAWTGNEVLGDFAADETEGTFLSPALGPSDLYVRLVTEDGAWSRTILTTGILEIPRGTLVILR